MKIAITLRIQNFTEINEKRDTLSHDWIKLFNEYNFEPVLIPNNLKNLELALLLFRVLLGIKDLEISQKEVADRIKHIVPVIKRRWTTLRTTITTFQTTMFQLINQQEESLKALLGGGGHILR